MSFAAAPPDGQQHAAQPQGTPDVPASLAPHKLNAQAPDFHPHGFSANPGYSPQMRLPHMTAGMPTYLPGLAPPRFNGPRTAPGLASPATVHMPPVGGPGGSPTIGFGGYPSFRAAASGTGQLNPNAPAFVPSLSTVAAAAATTASEEESNAPAVQVLSPHFDQTKVTSIPTKPDFVGQGMGFRPYQVPTEEVAAAGKSVTVSEGPVKAKKVDEPETRKEEPIKVKEDEKENKQEEAKEAKPEQPPESIVSMDEVKEQELERPVSPLAGKGETGETKHEDVKPEATPFEPKKVSGPRRITVESLINQKPAQPSAEGTLGVSSKFDTDAIKFDKFAKYRKSAEQSGRALGPPKFDWRASTKFADVLADLDQKTHDLQAVWDPAVRAVEPSILGGPIEPPAATASVSTPAEPPLELAVSYSSSGKRQYAISDLWAVRNAPRCSHAVPELMTSAMASIATGHQRPSPTSVEELYRSGSRTAAMAGSQLRIPTLKSTGDDEGFMRRREFGGDVSWSSPSHGDIARAPAAAPIVVPEDSWQVRQREQKETGSDTVKKLRKLRAQLNKMTPATYDKLYENIASQGLASSEELEQLVNLIFEKAITNHQYIVMYAGLCGDLQKSWDAKMGADSKGFRTVLLTCCQSCFKNNLEHDFVPTEGLDEEEQFEELLNHKKKMKGNLMFVGALAQQSLLSAKVLVIIMESLLEQRRPLQLEALAAFLPSATVQLHGSNKFRNELEAIFERVQKLAKDTSVDMRIQCLLRDAIDHRDRVEAEAVRKAARAGKSR